MAINILVIQNHVGMCKDLEENFQDKTLINDSKSEHSEGGHETCTYIHKYGPSVASVWSAFDH